MQDLNGSLTSREADIFRANQDLLAVNQVHAALFACESFTAVAETLTDALVASFEAHFARLWLVRPADLCSHCELAESCPAKQQCLHLVASSGYYTHIDGGHRRVPIGAFKIGLIAQGRGKTICNDVVTDQRVHDRGWAAEHGLRSFAGFPLARDGEVIGVMAMFSRKKLSEHLLNTLDLLAQLGTSAMINVERKQSLRESKEYVDNILRSMTNTVIVTAPDGTIVTVNAATCKLLGYREDELIGADVRMLVEEPADSTRHGELLGGSIVDKVTASRCISEVETSYVAKSGRKVSVLLSGSVTRRVDGKVQGIVYVAQDITARKQAETELQKLSRAVEHSPCTVVITNSHGIIEYVNPKFSELTGYTRDEALGQSPRILKSGKVRPEVYRELWTTIKSGKVWRGELLNLKKNGDLFWEASSIAPVIDQNGETTHFVAVKEDITQRRLAEQRMREHAEQLAESSRAAGMAEVATGILHNVGNVLNSVNVSANLLMQKQQSSRITTLAKASEVISQHRGDLANFLTNDPRGESFPRLLEQLARHLGEERESQLEELRTLLAHVEHIKEVISMQQAFARSAGSTEAVNLVDLIEDALRINEIGLSRHDVDVVRRFHEVPPVVTDRHKVLQILVNLISNALHALSAGSRATRVLTLTAVAEKESVCVEVTDNGVGIPKENLTKIFNHGFTTRKGGHGFGLHSSALAAQQIGGSLSAQSESPGRGATFTLRLPRQEQRSLCEG